MTTSKTKLSPGDHGFCITFDNGLSLSVQYGHGNYCDNRSWEAYDHTPLDPTATFEFAVWDKDEVWLLPQQVAGFVPMDDLPEIMQLVQNNQIAILIAKVETQDYAF